ncbi:MULTISPECIES: hypothetical protein [unclassified Pseudomonas]|uniref:hypothetical protein n=1 Tax=unclassified Pseudomonas TaxID=196821 RepID=UPI0021140167|nr:MULTISPECIES: hypothetical protein [unclassified Pseudomonas]
MQMNHAQTASPFISEVTDVTFDSVWGNAMQREDFLALAAGVRQFSQELAGLTLVSTAHRAAAEQA